jgi:2-polyprenyl-3-methyl-5-hydroxy-6-metoxy-1,4-benzoquinol methylase
MSTAAAEYFTAYEDLEVHRVMLLDGPRMEFYRSVLTDGRLKGKTVLDVGCGTGVLSMFAARGGAAHVHAVEASAMAHTARSLVEHNGLSAQITVHHCMVEDLVLPEGGKVDVIVSEWMGFALVQESMGPSVLHARDALLRPGGEMIPARARILASPVSTAAWRAERVDVWRNVGADLDLSPLIEPCLAQSLGDGGGGHVVEVVAPERLRLGPGVADGGAVLADFDMATVTAAEMATIGARVEFSASAGQFGGFVLWFDVDALGGARHDTSPRAPPTHWKQVVIPLPTENDFDVDDNDEITVELSLTQSPGNPRFYDISMEMV